LFKGSDGELIAASGIRMTPRDLVKIGHLCCARGVWDERVVVPGRVDRALHVARGADR